MCVYPSSYPGYSWEPHWLSMGLPEISRVAWQVCIKHNTCMQKRPWQCHVAAVSMMTSSNGNISALLAICAGNSPVTGEFPTQRPVTRSFDVYFDLRPNERLSKQSWGWWFETLSSPLWRHRNATGASIDQAGISSSHKTEVLHILKVHVLHVARPISKLNPILYPMKVSLACNKRPNFAISIRANPYNYAPVAFFSRL